MAMMTLTVPTPELVFDPPAGPPALEKPVTIRLASPRERDGTPVAAADVHAYGTLVYRGAIGAEEVWDEAAGRWIAVPLDPEALLRLRPIPVTAPTNPTDPWSGILVAFGQKDASGAPRFAKSTGSGPAYRVRGTVQAAGSVAPRTGISGPSPDFQFISASERQRFRVVFDTDDAASAGRARLLLQDGALRQAGYLEIRALGGREVEIASCDAGGAVVARVTLTDAGDIRLAPAAGRSIVLDGPLEAQQVRYQPAAGGARQTL
jgi:hypothetical protein